MNVYFIFVSSLVLYLSFFSKSATSAAMVSAQNQPLLFHPLVILPYSSGYVANHGVPALASTSAHRVIKGNQGNAVINNIENSGNYHSSGSSQGGITINTGNNYAQLRSLGKKDYPQNSVKQSASKLNETQEHDQDINSGFKNNEIQDGISGHNVINDNNQHADNIDNHGYYVNQGTGHGGITIDNNNHHTAHQNQLVGMPNLEKFSNYWKPNNQKTGNNNRQNIESSVSGHNVISNNKGHAVNSDIDNHGVYVNEGTGHSGVTHNRGRGNSQQKGLSGQKNQLPGIPSFQPFNYQPKTNNYQTGNFNAPKLNLKGSVTGHNVIDNNNGNAANSDIDNYGTFINRGVGHGGVTTNTGNDHSPRKGLSEHQNQLVGNPSIESFSYQMKSDNYNEQTNNNEPKYNHSQTSHDLIKGGVSGHSVINNNKGNAVNNDIENHGTFVHHGTGHGGVTIGHGGGNDNTKHNVLGEQPNQLVRIPSFEPFNHQIPTNNYQTETNVKPQLNVVKGSVAGHNVISNNNGNTVNSDIDNSGMYVNEGTGHGGVTNNGGNGNSHHTDLGGQSVGIPSFEPFHHQIPANNYQTEKNVKPKLKVNTGSVAGHNVVNNNNGNTVNSAIKNKGMYVNKGTGHGGVAVNGGNGNSERKVLSEQPNQLVRIPSFEPFNQQLTDSYQTGQHVEPTLNTGKGSVSGHNVINNNNGNAVNNAIKNKGMYVNQGTGHGGIAANGGNGNSESKVFNEQMNQLSRIPSFEPFNQQLTDSYQTGQHVEPTPNTGKGSVSGYNVINNNNGNAVNSDIVNSGMYLNIGTGHGGITTNSGNGHSPNPVVHEKSNPLVEIPHLNSEKTNTQINIDNNVYITNIDKKLDELNQKLMTKPDYSTAIDINKEIDRIDTDMKVLELQSLSPSLQIRIGLIREKARVLLDNIRGIIRTYVEIPLEEKINRLLIHLRNAELMKLTRRKLRKIHELEKTLNALKVDLHSSTDPNRIKILQLRLRTLEKELSLIRSWNLSTNLNLEVVQFERFCLRYGDVLPQLFHTFTGGLFKGRI